MARFFKTPAKRLLLKLLGEGTLIVMSILLALFIDDIKKDKEDLATERTYLTGIKNDLIGDTVRYQWRKSDLESILGYCDSIVSIKNASAEFSPSLTKNIDILFMSVIGIDFKNNPTFESMKFSSRIDMIKDLDLQKELVSYYSHGEFVNNVANHELQRITQLRRDLRSNSGLFLNFKITHKQAVELLSRPEIYNLNYDSIQTIYFVIEILDGRIKEAKQLIKEIDGYLVS